MMIFVNDPGQFEVGGKYQVLSENQLGNFSVPVRYVKLVGCDSIG